MVALRAQSIAHLDQARGLLSCRRPSDWTLGRRPLTHPPARTPPARPAQRPRCRSPRDSELSRAGQIILVSHQMSKVDLSGRFKIILVSHQSSPSCGRGWRRGGGRRGWRSCSGSGLRDRRPTLRAHLAVQPAQVVPALLALPHPQDTPATAREISSGSGSSAGSRAPARSRCAWKQSHWGSRRDAWGSTWSSGRLPSG